MTNYNVTIKIVRSATATIETVLATYINSLDSTKTIRNISCVHYGNDSVLAVVVSDV
jgi:hypothetical protein